MDFHVKGAAVEKFLEEVIQAYAELCPEDYADFCQICEEESKALKTPSGMSTGGDFMTFCKIPSTLYTFIKQQARKRLGIPDFFKEETSYRTLVRVWSQAKIRTKPTVRATFK